MAQHSALDGGPAILHEGTSGTVRWRIDAAGTLTFCPVTGHAVGVFADDACDWFLEEKPDWCLDDVLVTRVRFEGPCRATKSLNRMFADYENLVEVDLRLLDTTGVSDMSDMFRDCHSLVSLDLSTFDTSCVEDMTKMFSCCWRLKEIDLSSFDTSHVAWTDYMFAECSNLEHLDLTPFRASKLSSMEGMFGWCSSLVSLDLSVFDTSNVTNMSYLVSGCTSLTSLDLSSFDITKARNLDSMFSECESLESLDISSFSPQKGDAEPLRFGCSGMVKDCLRLRRIRLGAWLPHSFADVPAIWRRVGRKSLYGSTTLVDAYDGERMSGWWERIVPDCGVCGSVVWNFDGNTLTFCPREGSEGWFSQDLSPIEVTDSLGGTYQVPAWQPWAHFVNEVRIVDTCHATGSLAGMFAGMCRLRTLDLTGLETSNATSMDWMFYDCSSLTKLDTSPLDTSRTTTMHDMFCLCSQLTTLDLSGFKTSNVSNMSGMFWGCTALQSLDLTGFNTSRVVNMGEMFDSCESIVTLDLTGFDTSNVSNMDDMFMWCYSLARLALGESFIVPNKKSALWLPKSNDSLWVFEETDTMLTGPELAKRYVGGAEAGTWTRVSV